VSAEQSSGTPDLSVSLGQLPRLTVHLVDLPERRWVVNAPALTVWIDKDAGEMIGEWIAEATAEILAARDASNVVPLGHIQAPLRLRSVPH
jgi:hypothetical protein